MLGFSDTSSTHQRDSIPFRYTWPTELDLVAELAGMTYASGGRLGTGALHQ